MYALVFYILFFELCYAIQTTHRIADDSQQINCSFLLHAAVFHKAHSITTQRDTLESCLKIITCIHSYIATFSQRQVPSTGKCEKRPCFLNVCDNFHILHWPFVYRAYCARLARLIQVAGCVHHNISHLRDFTTISQLRAQLKIKIDFCRRILSSNHCYCFLFV